MIKDYFILAFRNLSKRKLRSWLTMLGIFISIATIFTLISLSLGLQGAIKEEFQTLGADKFFILPSTGFMGAPGTVGGIILTEEDVKIIEKVNGVKDISYMTIANIKMEYNKEIKYFMLIGLPLEKIDVFESTGYLDTQEGEILRQSDQGKILIGSLFASEKVYKKPISTGDKVLINDFEFRVKGILEPVGNPQDDTSIYISLEDLQKYFNVSNRVDQIIIQVEEGEDLVKIAEAVEKKLLKFRGQTEKTQDFIISTPEDLLESFQVILNIVAYFLAGIAGISLVVGAIGIANTMYTSVLERTKEIGVMKAIGARNSEIAYIFLIESGFLGLAGAGIGVILGFGLSKGIEYIVTNFYDTNLLQAAFPGYLIFGCLAFGFIIGAFSGTLPALQAGKTNTADALRYE